MIGDLLKTERKKAGLSQKALGEKAGISYVAINRIENGTFPRLSIATRLFGAMGRKLIFTLEDADEIVTAPLNEANVSSL